RSIRYGRRALSSRSAPKNTPFRKGPLRRLGAGPSRHAGTGRPRSRSISLSSPLSLRSPPMDQLALTFTSPGIGHNQPPEAIDAQAFNARLLATHVDLLARFCDFQLACGRMPDPIASEEDAATATDFIAQCQLQVKQ